jgi:NAD(P)H-dependent FMN reductase
MKKILAFAGSNSSTSINKKLIHAVAGFVTKSELEIIDLNDYPAPMFGVDLERAQGPPDSMIQLDAKMQEADGFIVASPEHNGSMPAFFKNILDWQSRIRKPIFCDKPTLFLSTSPGGRGGSSALQHLMAIMPFRGTKIIGGHAMGQFNDKVVDGKLIEGEDREAIVKLVALLEDSL